MIYLLVLFPLAMAAVIFLVPSNRWRPWLIPVGGLGQLGLVWTAIYSSAGGPPISGLEGWLILDALGKVIQGPANSDLVEEKSNGERAAVSKQKSAGASEGN